MFLSNPLHLISSLGHCLRLYHLPQCVGLPGAVFVDSHFVLPMGFLPQVSFSGNLLGSVSHLGYQRTGHPPATPIYHG